MKQGHSAPPPAGRIDEGALTVAMALAPGVYARNRMFGFHKDPAVRRAKARAAMLRGVIRQLGGMHGAATELTLVRSAGRAQLRYRVDAVHLERRLEMTDLEAGCFLYLASRAGVRDLQPSVEDRALIDAALRKLAVGLHLAAIDANTPGA